MIFIKSFNKLILIIHLKTMQYAFYFNKYKLLIIYFKYYNLLKKLKNIIFF